MGLSGSGINEETHIVSGSWIAGLVDDSIGTILSMLFCPYHFVLEPIIVVVLYLYIYLVLLAVRKIPRKEYLVVVVVVVVVAAVTARAAAATMTTTTTTARTEATNPETFFPPHNSFGSHDPASAKNPALRRQQIPETARTFSETRAVLPRADHRASAPQAS